MGGAELERVSDAESEASSLGALPQQESAAPHLLPWPSSPTQSIESLSVGFLDLTPDLIVIMLENVPFDGLLATRAACTRMRAHVLAVSRIVLERKEQLCVPLLQLFGASLIWLELESALPDWLPRLGSALAVLPNLQRLFIRR
eukprot:CAMPEP_0174741000 /NCGR_PEP_ID=MMETSP1094-20130205/75052_1 /TAXON_ID=156173 /ORGANISM="Chrysochromulina brevifilum, Strain UTEX LB 985" /LENGTH=143 /DNA_ID=CAMNT_0015944815 /DNA_START=1 /DNA_END=428 /DNA_ORIENTATION=+